MYENLRPSEWKEIFFVYTEHAPVQIRYLVTGINTAHKMKFSMKDFFSKCHQIHRKLRIWSHLLKKSLMKDFIFCAVQVSSMFVYEIGIFSKKFKYNVNAIVFITSFQDFKPYLGL